MTAIDEKKEQFRKIGTEALMGDEVLTFYGVPVFLLEYEELLGAILLEKKEQKKSGESAPVDVAKHK